MPTTWRAITATISPATSILVLRPDVHNALRIVSVIALLVQLGIWGNAFITFWTKRYARRGGGASGAETTALAAPASNVVTIVSQRVVEIWDSGDGARRVVERTFWRRTEE